MLGSLGGVNSSFKKITHHFAAQNILLLSDGRKMPLSDKT